MKYLILLMCLFMLAGCGKGISVEAMRQLSSDATNITGTAGSQIVDATTAKHYWLYDMWGKAMDAYGKAGMHVELDKDGRVKSFSNTPAPDLSRLPREIAPHAVWQFLTKATQYGITGWMGVEFAGVLKSGYSHASPETVYGGDLVGSQNDGDFTFQRDNYVESFNPDNSVTE